MLQYVSEQQAPATAVDIAEGANLPLPTAMRLLASLAAERLVEFDEERRLYRPGPALLRMIALAGRSGWYSNFVRAPLKGLAQATGETACLNVLMPGDKFSLVACEEGTQPLRYVVELGGLHSFERGAGGKAILAHLPLEQQKRVIAAADDPKALRAAVTVVRRDGFALTFSERVEGAVGVATPVFGAGGAVWGSVQVTIPEHRFDKASLPIIVQALTRAAENIAFDDPQSGGAP